MHTIPTASAANVLLKSAGLVALVGAFAMCIATGDAQARERNGTATGANGKTATRSVARQHGDVNSSTTGPNGKMSSRKVDHSATGTSATMTGPNGKTASRETVRTETGSQTTVTGPKGETGSVTVTH